MIDSYIANCRYTRRNGLNICEDGIAYQIDMSKSVPYDKAYFDKYVAFEKTELGIKLNEYRVNMVELYCRHLKIIDIGAGCGTFVKMANKNDLNAYGYDINEYTINWLKRRNLYHDISAGDIDFTGITFWDSLEHIPEPQRILRNINLGAYVFVSIPIYGDFDDIENSKHYRPDEHYYYFTAAGLMKWFREYGLCLIGRNDFESEMGRENIKTFTFEKRLLLKKNGDVRRRLESYFADQQQNSENIAKGVLK